MRYEELISGAEKLIRRYFNENLKEYHYESEDAEDEVQCAIEDFICDTKDFISEGIRQLDYSLEENTKEEENHDLEDFVVRFQL